MAQTKIILIKDGRKITKEAAARDCGVTSKTINRWINADSYKLQDNNIEVVRCEQHPHGYWICEDGEIRMKNWKKYPKVGRKKNMVRINGEYIKVAQFVWYAFTREWEDKLLFLDGNLRNCRLENLEKMSKKCPKNV